MEMTYYDTTNLTGSELKKAKGKATSQAEDVLTFFQAPEDAPRMVSPEMILTAFRAINPEKYGNTPLNSIRRSCSDLKNKGKLYKTDTMVMGWYGRRVHCWKLR